MKLAILVAMALVTLCTCQNLQAPAPSPNASEHQGFIRVVNGRFVDSNCGEFPVTGMNTWLLMEAAAGLAYIPCTFPGGMDAVQHTFSIAADSGFTVVRVFAHGVNATLALQMSPGEYNETAFAALDYILDTAAYNNVKVIFTMGDNWQYVDSKRNYSVWAGFDEDSDEFWSSNATRQMYKDHMLAMVNRTNTLTGVKYRDDPTIFAWDLMNEPRCNCFPSALPYPAIFATLPPGCDPSCADTITSWVVEMSAYLKSIDSNHLVTVGEEGFWGYYDADIVDNPENSVSPWAALTGNNFTAQHSFDSIDYTSIHYWPDQWTPKATSDNAFFTTWVEGHKENSKAMGKPLVLEELGKRVTANLTEAILQSSILDVREPFMQMVYGQFNQSLQTGDIWRGTLFWKWGFCPENDQTDSLQVSSGDVDFKNVIVPASMSAISQALSASPIANCSVVPVAEALVAVEVPTPAPADSQVVLPQEVASSLPSIPAVAPASGIAVPPTPFAGDIKTPSPVETAG